MSGASMLGNMLTGKGVVRAGRGYNDHMDKYFQFHYIEITKYFNREFRFNDNGVYSRNRFPRTKNEAYVINLDEKQSKGAHQISYLVTEIQLCTGFLLHLIISLKIVEQNKR